MDSVGGFRREEIDGKQFLVYHLMPQTQNLSFSSETTSHDQPLQPLFLCPHARQTNDYLRQNSNHFPLNSSPKYNISAPRFGHHPVLPLYWCNNKDFDSDGGCEACNVSNFGTNYYFCEYHQVKFHKECVESSLKIKHPYHPEHFLQLYCDRRDRKNNEYLCCGETTRYLVYYCTICQVCIHPICTIKPIPFVIDQPKRHDHSLTFFPRHTSLVCNVCGLLRKSSPTYVCLICNFVAHKDCMYSPHIIKISRHHHRISYISSLQSREWSCGVCRQRVNCDYGAYTCDKCSDYVVHSRCALGKNVWDGKELEGVPEEDDITQDAKPFDIISEGVILYFLHEHHLRFEVNILYDENKLCQACVLPIYEGNLYSCIECEFILHELHPRRIQHGLHPHPLTLKSVSRYRLGSFFCWVCYRICGGFVYGCCIGDCKFNLDVRRALISEPFDFKAHEHPLFLTLDPINKPICEVCKIECQKQINCIKCNFIVCFKCATLPYKARYKHDKHFLTVLFGKEINENDCCEICECDLNDTVRTIFYWCKECCTIFHINCLFGEFPYMKPGQSYRQSGKEFQILGKSKISRPICDYCKNRCQDKVFKGDYGILCSRKCLISSG
ncbi:hypothetical protein EUTSA_v10024120mg [Eutrema salsugineum]|uniref:Phorbol-ester/DAG-type domain-containing protein n=1 Tax=Eutrema salsugineum TaxID=72664 RepID=V4KHA5_EUTSA|nr:hypothetical protein EUTSA_v10024120mg [Eutrema salsugineum]